MLYLGTQKSYRAGESSSKNLDQVTCIQEMPGSNLSEGTSYSDCVHGFPLSL